jgi:hypothetical protein
METRAFQPLYTPATGTTAGTLSASTTVAASVANAFTTAFAGTLNNQVVQIQIANQTTAWAYVNFGVVGAVAAATIAASYPVAPGAVVVVSVAAEVNGAAVILAAGATAGSVTFTRGEGL